MWSLEKEIEVFEKNAKRVHELTEKSNNLYIDLYTLYSEIGSCECSEAVADVIKDYAGAWEWDKVNKLANAINRIEENEAYAGKLF